MSERAAEKPYIDMIRTAACGYAAYIKAGDELIAHVYGKTERECEQRAESLLSSLPPVRGEQETEEPELKLCSCVGHCRGREGLSQRFTCALDMERGKVPFAAPVRAEAAKADTPFGRLYGSMPDITDEDITASSPVRAEEAKTELAEMEARKDAAYLERNQVVAALARCFPSGVARTAIEGWSDDWHGCVYIDLPTGQVSWHFHDSQAYLFAGLPAYTKGWDGHTTEQKYRRLAALSSPVREAEPLKALVYGAAITCESAPGDRRVVIRFGDNLERAQALFAFLSGESR